MSLKVPITFVNQFNDILYKQNEFLLKELCNYKKWNYLELHNKFLKKDEFNINSSISEENVDNVSIRVKWESGGKIYFLESETNNVYDEYNNFLGKKIGDILDTSYEET